MKKFDAKTYHIIGMSPGNSYFKGEEIHYLLKTVVERFGRVAVLIADIPAISTYVALGYSENRARRDKAIPKGNALKNRVKKSMADLGYSDDVVKIFDWENEIESNPIYKKQYQKISRLYKTSKDFHKLANLTTRSVLEGSKNNIADIKNATDVAVHYLFSELAFLEFAPACLGVDKIVYVYHKNWEVYEDYIAGKFDGIAKPHMDFLLLENPYETYNPIWGLEDEENEENFKDILERIEKTKVLRVGFTNYVPAFMHDRDYNNFSGIFYEIIIKIAKKYKWQVRFSEEVGYGVVIDGLDNKRFDIFGSPIWPIPERKSKADFSISLYKSPVFVWVRPNSKKTENALVAVKENDITDSIAKSDFPDSRHVRVPQLSDTTELLKFVAQKRADFTFVEPYTAEHFNRSSDIKLVPTSKDPIRVYENTFIIKKGEKRLKKLLDKELLLLKQDGTVTELIKKYTGAEDTFIVE